MGTNMALEPNNDPEIAQNGVDFLYRLIPSHIKNLLNYPSSSLEFLFIFSLKALTGNNPLPKFSAVEFWVCCRILSTPCLRYNFADWCRLECLCEPPAFRK